MVMSKASSGEAVAALWAVTDEGQHRLISENSVGADAHIGRKPMEKSLFASFYPSVNVRSGR